MKISDDKVKFTIQKTSSAITWPILGNFRQNDFAIPRMFMVNRLGMLASVFIKGSFGVFYTHIFDKNPQITKLGDPDNFQNGAVPA